MKKFGFFLFVAALAIGIIGSSIFSFGKLGGKWFNFSDDFGGVHGSGHVAAEHRDLSGFESIDVGGVFQVEIVAQQDFKVEVEADDNLLSHIETDVRGNTLHIATDGRLKTDNPIKIRISAPNIDSLDVSGAATVSLSNIKNLSLNVDASGASKISVSGETAKLIVDISGATKVNADELRATDALIEASGASYVGVHVSGELRSDLSGASRVEYTGTPTNIETKKSGAGKVTAK